MNLANDHSSQNTKRLGMLLHNARLSMMILGPYRLARQITNNISTTEGKAFALHELGICWEFSLGFLSEKRTAF